jgi:hypothetical protein
VLCEAHASGIHAVGCADGRAFGTAKVPPARSPRTTTVLSWVYKRSGSESLTPNLESDPRPSWDVTLNRAPVAQRTEQEASNFKAAGSSPAGGTPREPPPPLNGVPEWFRERLDTSGVSAATASEAMGTGALLALAVPAGWRAEPLPASPHVTFVARPAAPRRPTAGRRLCHCTWESLGSDACRFRRFPRRDRAYDVPDLRRYLNDSERAAVDDLARYRLARRNPRLADAFARLTQ